MTGRHDIMFTVAHARARLGWAGPERWRNIKMDLLVSCISTKHSTLKKHWADTGQQLTCPLTVRGSLQKPNEDLGGLLCLVVDGALERTLPLSMAACMVPADEGILVTTATSIHEVDPQLRELRRDVISLPLFNALH